MGHGGSKVSRTLQVYHPVFGGKISRGMLAPCRAAEGEAGGGSGSESPAAEDIAPEDYALVVELLDSDTGEQLKVWGGRCRLTHQVEHISLTPS